MLNHLTRTIAAACGAALIAGGSAALADLTITLPKGDGTRTEVVLTLDELGAMDQVEVVTANDYVDGTVTFSGPLARDVLEHVGAGQAGMLRLTAANDYAIEIDAADFRQYDVILSLSIDGKPLSLRDKGPIWLMYPIDDHSELQVPATNNKLIWQLVRMDVQ